jgi:hypothetical protein
MTDQELESKLREGLRATDLPAAPASLRLVIADLAALETSRPGRRRRGVILLAAAALVLSGLGASGLLTGALPQQRFADAAPSTDHTPSAVTTTTPPLAAPPIPAGFVPFEAPGVRFAHPADWEPSTAFDNYPDVLGQRVVGMFGRGLTICPNTEGVFPVPTKPPGGCATEASSPGSLVVQVVEFTRQLPTTDEFGVATTYAGYPAWTRDDDGSDPATMSWAVAGPDDGLYLFWTSVPREDIDEVRAEMEATLATLQLSSWQEPAEVVDGRIHLETHQGFSFDYPAGWTVYHPNDASMMDHAVVTVASQRLEACPTEACQRFTTPPGTVAIEFRIGRGPNEPDWTRASETVGGQPASVQHWGSDMVTGADEGHQWNVRLDNDRKVLGIYASLRGPGLTRQLDAMNDILKSVIIDAPPPGDH